MTSSTSGAATWRLDELANAGRENLDADHVARYDEKEDAAAAAEVALLEVWGLGGDAVVVDLGAGTGQFTIEAARHCAKVVAVDVSSVMIEQLRAKVVARRQGNVEIVEAGFLTYDHAGPPADIVYSRWALHHIPDFWKVEALRRMHDILRPGGILRLADIVYSFDPSEATQRLEQWCSTLPETAPDGEWVRADIEDHIRDEHSTYSWLLETMIERAGFTVERASYSDDQFFAEYIARAARGSRRHR